MNRTRTALAIGLCALLLLGCTAPTIINSDPKQDKIQIVGEIVHDTPTPEPESAAVPDVIVTDPDTPEPTEAPTEEPTPEPTEEPTPEPTEEPTPEPTEEPTPESTPAPTPDRTKAEALCDTATSLIDVAYHRGGTSTDTGFDPGGFVYYCLNAVGCKVRHKTSKGYSEMTDWQRIDSMDDLEVGDLCFFQTPGNDAVNCVTIYLGANRMIYPSSGEGKVITAKITSNYWKEAFVFARRVF